MLGNYYIVVENGFYCAVGNNECRNKIYTNYPDHFSQLIELMYGV